MEAFLKAIEKIDTYDPRCRPSIWLCTIGRNLYINQCKCRILEIPAIRDALESGEAQSLPLEEVEADIRSVLPEDAEYIYIDITGKHHVSIDYRSQGIRVILSYADMDGGKADAISKTIGVPESEEEWSAVEVYRLQYSIALGRAWYEKLGSQHTWFGFLNMP